MELFNTVAGVASILGIGAPMAVWIRQKLKCRPFRKAFKEAVYQTTEAVSSLRRDDDPVHWIKEARSSLRAARRAAHTSLRGGSARIAAEACSELASLLRAINSFVSKPETVADFCVDCDRRIRGAVAVAEMV